MKPTDFQPNSPGVVEPAVFSDLGPNGLPRTIPGSAFVPNPLPPLLQGVELHGRLFDVLDQARDALARLDSLVDGLSGRTALLTAMRVVEAQASSRIENTVASLDEISMATVAERRATSQSLEVVRNRRAIEHGLNSPLPICVRLVREMHEILIRDPVQRPGMFRDRQVYIGSESGGFEGARFVPPPPDRVTDLMSNWERFCNSRSGPGPHAPDGPRFAYFIELALAHYQFETIHPFSDGNGRLGRALITLAPVKDRQLRNPVCNVSEWIQTRRQEYYDRLLAVSTRGDWEGWIRFFCAAVAGQAITDSGRARALHSLYERYRGMITTRRGSILPMKLLDHLFDRQAVTVAVAGSVMGVSKTQAQRHVDTFVRKGILEPIEGGRYGRVYVARGVIQSIQGAANA